MLAALFTFMLNGAPIAAPPRPPRPPRAPTLMSTQTPVPAPTDASSPHQDDALDAQWFLCDRNKVKTMVDGHPVVSWPPEFAACAGLQDRIGAHAKANVELRKAQDLRKLNELRTLP